MTTPCVLIVDDDPGIRPLLSAVCTRIGYECHTASDGVEAVEQIQTRRFDLVLLDLMMPRKNGYEVIEFLRTLAEPPKVIVLTAQGQRQTSTIVPDGMIGAVLHKPFDLEALVAVIKQMAKPA